MTTRLERRGAGSLHALAVACLCVPCCPTPVRAQATEASARVDAVPTAAITSMLADLDALFARGDTAGYLGAFEPDNPGAHAMLTRDLEQLFEAGVALRRSSALTTEPRVIGDRTVVRVRHEVRFAAPGAAQGAAEQSFVVDNMLALRRTAEGRAVPTFCVEIPTRFANVRGDLFRCPPCNFEVGGVAGWLCVPMRGDRSLSIEMASFFLIGTDVACDVTVQIDPDVRAATTVAQGLGGRLRSLDADSRPGLATTWLPAAHAATPPAGFAGARVEVVLPHDFGGAGGLCVFHVLTFGGLQQVLLARGSVRAMREHAAAVQALLDSYHLLESDLDQVAAAARALRHHTGGALKGTNYVNDRFLVTLDGPPSWRPQQRCGGSAFRVVWSSENGSRLWLTGYGVPQGMHRWCRRTADRWLQQLCHDHELKPDPNDPAEWTEQPGCSALTRSFTCSPISPPGPDAPRQRTLVAHLHDDLLIVADGYAATAADEVALRQALGSLRRR